MDFDWNYIIPIWYCCLCTFKISEKNLLHFPDDSHILIFISDLHMGIGKNNGIRKATEDFQWPNTLEGFLDEISRRGNDSVDIIFVGGFLELWHPLEDLKCIGVCKDIGCSIAEIQKIIERVMRVHTQEMVELKALSQESENRIHIITESQNSTKLLSEIWGAVNKAKVEVKCIVWDNISILTLKHKREF